MTQPKTPNWLERPSKEPGGKPERYVHQTDPAVKDALAELQKSYQALMYPGTGVTLAAAKAVWVDIAHLLEILARKPATYVATCRFCGTSREVNEGDVVTRCPCSETIQISSPPEVRYAAAKFEEAAGPVRLNSSDPALDPTVPPVITQLACTCGAVWRKQSAEARWERIGGNSTCGICIGLLQFRENIGAATKVSLSEIDPPICEVNLSGPNPDGPCGQCLACWKNRALAAEALPDHELTRIIRHTVPEPFKSAPSAGAAMQSYIAAQDEALKAAKETLELTKALWTADLLAHGDERGSCVEFKGHLCDRCRALDMIDRTLEMIDS